MDEDEQIELGLLDSKEEPVQESDQDLAKDDDEYNAVANAEAAEDFLSVS
jgi:hypothetical protein